MKWPTYQDYCSHWQRIDIRQRFVDRDGNPAPGYECPCCGVPLTSKEIAREACRPSVLWIANSVEELPEVEISGEWT